MYLRIGTAIVVVLVPVAVYLTVNAWLNEQRRESVAAAEARVRHQIADFKSGKVDRICFSNEVSQGGLEMTAFLNAKREVGEATPYKLQIWYSHNVDQFLKQLEGSRGLRSLLLYKTDVTLAGIESIATLPDLQELSIAYIRETEGGSEERLSNIHLKSLATSLAPLESAGSLKKLTLVGEDLPGGEVDAIRKRRADCAISVERPQ